MHVWYLSEGRNMEHKLIIKDYEMRIKHSIVAIQKKHNINWRDVQTKNVVNNVDMSSLKNTTS